MRRSRVITLGSALAVIGLVAVGFALWQQTYAAQTEPIRRLIDAGEQWWPLDSERLLERMIHRSNDCQVLAEQLITDHDQNLVAEGMVLAVVSEHPRAKQLLVAHQNDSFVNWQMSTNGELAKELLLYLDRKPVEQYVTWWVGRVTGAAS